MIAAQFWVHVDRFPPCRSGQRVRMILIARSCGVRYRRLAEAYGVTPSTIRLLEARGQTWLRRLPTRPHVCTRACRPDRPS